MKDIKNIVLKTVDVDKPDVELGFDQVLRLVALVKDGSILYGALADNGGFGLDDIKDLPEVIDFIGEAKSIFDVKELLLAQLKDVDLDEADELVEKIANALETSTEEAKIKIHDSVYLVYYIYRNLINYGAIDVTEEE